MYADAKRVLPLAASVATSDSPTPDAASSALAAGKPIARPSQSKSWGLDSLEVQDVPNKAEPPFSSERVQLNVEVDTIDRDRLRSLADLNERSLAAEARVALRFYMQHAEERLSADG